MTYAFANMGGTIGYLPLLTFLLPARIERIAPAMRLDLLTAAAVVGALAASVSNIAFGWISDRYLAAGRNRRQCLAVGIALTALSYPGLIVASSPGGMLVAVAVFQIAINALLAPLAAIMADEVPDERKGFAAGLLALAVPGAWALTAGLVNIDGPDDTVRLAVIPVLAAALIAPLLLTRAPQAPSAAAPSADRPHLPLDLASAWLARLLVQIAGIVLSLYLLYYAESLAPGASRTGMASRVGWLLASASAAALPLAMMVGQASDRSRRRKPFLVAAAGVAAAGLAVMALARSWPVAAIGIALQTAGAAVFLALHTGFAMQLLPDRSRHGYDLGWFNLTNTLPSIIGALLAWWLATPSDFSGLMMVLALLTLAGGATTLAIRGQR